MSINVLAAVIRKRVIALGLQDRLSVDRLAGHLQNGISKSPGSRVVLVERLAAMTGAKKGMEAPIGKEVRKPEDVRILWLLFPIPSTDNEGGGDTLCWPHRKDEEEKGRERETSGQIFCPSTSSSSAFM